MAADTKHIAVADCQPPDSSMKIWRYLDLPKLIDLLQTRSLYFARVNSLQDEDPFEGSFAKGNLDLLRKQLLEPKEVIKGKSLTEEHVHNLVKIITGTAKDFAYINCWHASDTESVALWKQYGTEKGAIVIRSTYEKLVRAFPDNDQEKTVHMGMIQYLNYANPEEYMKFNSNLMTPLFHKRIEYQHEREVRALVFLSPDRANDQNGFKINIDVDKVIEEIRMGPRTPKWITEIVAKLIEKYDLHLKVLPSQLDEKPIS